MPRYVIYNKETTRFLRNWLRDVKIYTPIPVYGDGYFKTEAAAKAAMTRAIKALGADPVTFRKNFAIAEANEFHASIEKKEVRHGIVHCAGKEYEVGVNEPWTSGPWSETYWSS